MALIYTVEKPSDVVVALLANDEFLGRILNYATDYFDDYQSEFLLKELYAAPYCFVDWTRQSKSHNEKRYGLLIFTAMVPWTNEIYRHVRDEMDHLKRPMIPHLFENVDEFLQKYLSRTDGNEVHTFTKHGFYLTVDDVKENDFDERAMTVTCAAMGWEIPSEWRKWRQDGLNWLHMKSSPSIDHFINFKANHCRTTHEHIIRNSDNPAEIDI